MIYSQDFSFLIAARSPDVSCLTLEKWDRASSMCWLVAMKGLCAYLINWLLAERTKSMAVPGNIVLFLGASFKLQLVAIFSF